MSSPLSLEEVKAKATSFPAGKRIRVKWAKKSHLAEIFTWCGIVRDVKDGYVTVVYDDVPGETFALPHHRDELVYFVVEAEDAPTYGDYTKAVFRGASNALNINHWKPETWKEYLGGSIHDRVVLVNELSAFYGLKARSNLGTNAGTREYEKAALYDVLIAWISFAQSVEEWRKAVPIILPVIHRLCALKRGSGEGITDQERTKEMDAVYEALLKSDNQDHLSAVMGRPILAKK
eukprot:PhF_6_TR2265/c1_g4_i2/m.3901